MLFLYFCRLSQGCKNQHFSKAQWNHHPLRPCSPGFESQAQHLCIFQFRYVNQIINLSFECETKQIMISGIFLKNQHYFFIFYLFFFVKRGRARTQFPQYKLCFRVSYIRGNRRGQLLLSAMDKPRSGSTAFMITVKLLSQVNQHYYS